MIYKAVEVIWIFSADGQDVTGRDGRTGIEGTIRYPCGPKNRKTSIMVLCMYVQPKNVK